MNNREFDLERAKLLIDEISRNLAVLPADSAKYAEARKGLMEIIKRRQAELGQPAKQ